MLDPQEYIRNIATYYPDSDSIHRILEYADVDIINLDLEGKPLNIWFMALKEVARQDKLPGLIQIIAAEYPGLAVNEKEQGILKRFFSKQTGSTDEIADFFQRHRSMLLKIGILGILVFGYFIVVNMLKVKQGETDAYVVTQADTTLSNAIQFVVLRYKEEPFHFPAGKNIFQLKQYLLYNKENTNVTDAAKSKLTYQGQLLSNEQLISDIEWSGDGNIDLWISKDFPVRSPKVDIFLQGISLNDPVIFIEDQAGYVSDVNIGRTRLEIPKILGDHTLEIFFQDSMAVIPLHMEYSTANISITADEFHKYSKRISKVFPE